ncbi:MAG: formyltetrahydrofolate deformylase [Alphaproteobacteria bacterium]
MSHLLIVSCADETGLIAKVTTALFERNLNITSNWEFVDQQNKRFFMRADFDGDCDIEGLRTDLATKLPKDADITIEPPRRKRIVLMGTKESHCLGDLLLRADADDLNGDILGVVSNHDTLQPLVSRFDIPYHFVSHENIDRRAHEDMLHQILEAYDPDYIVLAKYMRILSPDFVAQYAGKMINIHHSFLPAFIGAHPYKQAYQRGVKIIGATAHFVTNDLDEGPIISQQVIPVDHSHSIRDMSRAGQDVEKITLAKALQLVLEDRVVVTGNRTVIFE